MTTATKMLLKISFKLNCLDLKVAEFERAERIFQHLILETEFGCLWPHNALN